MYENRTVPRQKLVLTTACALVFTLPAATLGTSSCGMVPLAAGETWRGAGAAPGDAHCFEVDVPAAGVLAIEASAGAAAAAAPRLFAADAECRAIRPHSRALVLAEGASHLALWAPAGTHRLCAGAQDPERRLATLRLSTSFVELGLGLPAKDGEDPREIEVEPEGLIFGGVPKDGEDPREIEVEPEGLVSGPPATAGGAGDRSISRWLRDELCDRRPVADDHGDTFFCATELAGGSVTGELANAWGDDADVFELAVASTATFEIRTAGAADTSGSLYDHRGLRLAADGGRSGNFRLVKTLLPGRYFVRVESTSYDPGRYRLLAAPIAAPAARLSNHLR